jgi:hypothetical protein
MIVRLLQEILSILMQELGFIKFLRTAYDHFYYYAVLSQNLQGLFSLVLAS